MKNYLIKMDIIRYYLWQHSAALKLENRKFEYLALQK